MIGNFDHPGRSKPARLEHPASVAERDKLYLAMDGRFVPFEATRTDGDFLPE